MLASTIVFAILLATARADETWEVVTSDQGKYKVEMPACEEQSGTVPIIGRGMSGTLHDSLRNADDVIYRVKWYESSRPIGKADEGRWFDYVRDQEAGFGANGKVVSEAKVKVGTVDAREYAYLKELAGSKTEARARAVVKGNSVYVLIASPGRGDKLDAAKADRFFNSLSFDVMPSAARPRAGLDAGLLVGTWEVSKGNQPPVGSTLEFSGGGKFKVTIKGQPISFEGAYKLEGDQLTLTPPGSAMSVRELSGDKLLVEGPGSTMEYKRRGAVASAMPRDVRPSPSPRAKAASKPLKAAPSPLREWGKEVDPDGDVDIEASCRSLTIRVPATPHVLSAEIDKFNAPRVVAPIRGDFVATVRVDGGFDPGQESTTRKISPRQAGGLLLWKDESNHIVLQRRTVVGKEGQSNRQVIFDERQGGKNGEGHNQPAPEGPIYLRLERKGGRISGAFSADGKDWKPFKPIDAPWAEGTAQVGVMAVNTSTGTHTVTFEDYSLKAK